MIWMFSTAMKAPEHRAADRDPGLQRDGGLGRVAVPRATPLMA